MRAVVTQGVQHPLTVEVRPVPTPGPGELLARVAAGGVYGSDLHLADALDELPDRFGAPTHPTDECKLIVEP
ncbi:MAG TPA: hypothetical protein VFF40_00320 [Acidimicrobiia bacterium]|nr:hypothetical protein [Acidimicrobiia bacterium]